MRNGEKLRRTVVLVLGAMIYALLFALCSQIDESGSVTAAKAVSRFALAWPLALGILWVLWRCVMPRCALEKPAAAQTSVFWNGGVFVLLVCCYVPMFLIEYPGSFMYDTQRQVFQVVRGEYEMFHPLLHTLLIRACLSLVNVFGSLEKCAALYSVIQILLTALCFSQVCASVRRTCGGRAAGLSVLFFGFYPAHMAFASNCTKDGLFSAFFALFFALCMEDMILGGLPAGRRAMHLAAGVLSCLFRNNMVYALAAWAVVSFFCLRHSRRMALCALLAVVISFGANGALQRLTDARDSSRIEMLSVPVQQLSRARLERPECFSDEEKALMDLVFTDALYGTPEPLYMHYEPTLADPVKNYLDEALVLERFSDLARMWVNVGAKCPGVYLDAFLNLALPSLYPYSEYKVAQPYIETGLQPGVVTAPYGQPPMTQPDRFEGIRRWLDERIFSTGADDVPLLRYLFNTGFVFWMLLMIVLYELYSGNTQRFVLLLLPVLLWGTYLLGPVMQGRYLYPFICVLPMFVFRPVKDKRDM